MELGVCKGKGKDIALVISFASIYVRSVADDDMAFLGTRSSNANGILTGY